MGAEDEIKWVTLTLDFTPEQEAVLENAAQQAGLSAKCYCIYLIFKYLPEDGSPDDNNRLQAQLPATLRRNGCEESSFPTLG